MLKVELHAHTDQDPADRISHSTPQLIDHAAALGYQALAITLHDRYFDPRPWAGYARERGVVLLAGIELSVAGRHVLLINFSAACAAARSFAEIERLRRSGRGLVVAPHPFYPTPSALRGQMDRHAGAIDAVEFNSMYTRWIDFNRGAAAWARRHGKPLVGNTDLHVLDQMGTTYSLVDAAPEPDAICEAIRAGRVELHTAPLTDVRAAGIFGRMLLGGLRGRAARAVSLLTGRDRRS